MIRVHRGAEPDVITRKRQRWLDALHSAGTPAQTKRALGKYKHAQIRDALLALFHGKCAYCETKTQAATWGHIEHYRPKQGPNASPDKAFDWDNLLWACPRCNSEFKGDQFPDAPDGGPIVNPCQDEPGDHLEFDWDPVTRIASVWGESERGQTTESVLQLNRPDLRTERSGYVEKLAALAKLAAKADPPDRDEALDILARAKDGAEPYAAFARALDV